LLRQGLLPADTRGAGSVSHLPPASHSAVLIAARADQPAGEPQYNPHPKKLETSFICVGLQSPHGGDCEEFCLLGRDDAWSVEIQTMFRRKISPPSSAMKSKPNKKAA
jgi:hypothetical protein